MAAFLVVLAAVVGAWTFAIAMCRAAAAGDRQLRDAAARRRDDDVRLARQRGEVVDIGTARRRRNGEALGRRA